VKGKLKVAKGSDEVRIHGSWASNEGKDSLLRLRHIDWLEKRVSWEGIRGGSSGFLLTKGIPSGERDRGNEILGVSPGSEGIPTSVRSLVRRGSREGGKKLIVKIR